MNTKNNSALYIWGCIPPSYTTLLLVHFARRLSKYLKFNIKGPTLSDFRYSYPMRRINQHTRPHPGWMIFLQIALLLASHTSELKGSRRSLTWIETRKIKESIQYYYVPPRFCLGLSLPFFHGPLPFRQEAQMFNQIRYTDSQKKTLPWGQ